MHSALPGPFRTALLTMFVVLVVSSAAVSAPAPICAGDAAPSITLRDMNNRLVFCKEILKTKPVLVSFFFTGCLPCKKEIPDLERLKSAYGGKVKFLMISTDKAGADAVEPFIAEMKVTIDVLIDKYSDAARGFGVTQYPTVFIIGKDGKVVYTCAGYREDNIRNIEAILKKMK